MSRSSSSPLLRHPISAWSPDRRRPGVQEEDPLPGPSGCVTSCLSTRRDSAGWRSCHELRRTPGECGVWRTLSKIRNTFESSSSLAGWSDYLHLCHSVVNTAQGRKRHLKKLHFDWAGPRVLVGRSAGKAVETRQRAWTALIFQSNTGHCETWWEQVTPHSQIRVTLLSQRAGEGRRRQLEASEQRRAPRPSAEVGTPPQHCSDSGEKWG